LMLEHSTDRSQRKNGDDMNVVKSVLPRSWYDFLVPVDSRRAERKLEKVKEQISNAAANGLDGEAESPAPSVKDLDWTTLALMAGGGLLSHSVASELAGGDNDENGKRKPAWRRALSKILPLGAAGLGIYGGYALGDMLKKKAADTSEVLDLISGIRKGRDTNYAEARRAATGADPKGTLEGLASEGNLAGTVENLASIPFYAGGAWGLGKYIGNLLSARDYNAKWSDFLRDAKNVTDANLAFANSKVGLGEVSNAKANTFTNPGGKNKAVSDARRGVNAAEAASNYKALTASKEPGAQPKGVVKIKGSDHRYRASRTPAAAGGASALAGGLLSVLANMNSGGVDNLNRAIELLGDQ